MDGQPAANPDRGGDGGRGVDHEQVAGQQQGRQLAERVVADLAGPRAG